MCQMSIVLEKDQKSDVIIEEVTNIQITDKGLLISTFFDEPRMINDAIIKEIDCTGSKITLIEKEQ